MSFHSIKFRLIVMVLAIVVVSNVALELIASRLSTATVTDTTKQLLDSVTESVSYRIADENNKQFHALLALEALDFIRDENVSVEEKCNLLRDVTYISAEYEDILYFDTDGNSFTLQGAPIHIPDREYLQETLKGKNYVDDTMMSPVNNSLLQHYTVPVYNTNKKVIGVLCANVNGDNLSNLIKDITIGQGSHPIVISRKTGKTVASSNIDDVKNEQNLTQEGDVGMKDVISALMRGEEGTAAFYNESRKQKIAAAYEPIEGTEWSVLVLIPYSDFFGALTRMTHIMTIALVVILILSLVLSGTLLSKTIKPLQILKEAITEIASGDADLTRRIDSKSKDEIGDVVNGFNKFTGKLHEIISQVKDSKGTLGAAGQSLKASTEDTASSITEILANIESVHTQINNQANSVHQTAGAVNEIASNIESLEKMIEKQSSGVSAASAAVEEMIGNIRSVNASMEKMSSSFNELTASAQSGAQIQHEVNDKIEQIKNQSETLQEANVAIAAIAEQTNLLAMNAAIEAAHAGDAGKGFAVVADEIRKLSETSSQQSKTIGEELTSIQNSIVGVVTASEQSSRAFESVTDKIKVTDELVRQIKAAMEEQTEGSQQINDALHTMNDSTLEVRTAGQEMAEGNKAILEEVRNLQDATGVMQDSMNEMSIGARKINETGEALRGIALQMEDSINEIGGQIDRFKV